jgi:hypothetical protein
MANISSDYIIRIYRFDKNSARRFVGTVEGVGMKGKRVFTTIEELWEILTRIKEGDNKGKDENPNFRNW